MKIYKRLLAKTNDYEIMEFTCPVSIEILQSGASQLKQIESALDYYVNKYVGNEPHNIYADYFTPARPFTRLVIKGKTSNIDFKEIDTDKFDFSISVPKF